MDVTESSANVKIALTLMLVLSSMSTVSCIDCFKCVSTNGRFAPCDDPFHNNHSLALLESPCMGGRKGRDGLFPATSCIKIAGVFGEERRCEYNECGELMLSNKKCHCDAADTGETITVRGCGLDSGTVTTDTEIIRMSHCGRFYYNDRYVAGCLQSCNDADACNGGDDVTKTTWPAVLSIIFTQSLTYRILYIES